MEFKVYFTAKSRLKTFLVPQKVVPRGGLLAAADGAGKIKPRSETLSYAPSQCDGASGVAT